MVLATSLFSEAALRFVLLGTATGALTALVALNREVELELHIRAALRNGLTRAEITEVLLQSAVYCGVPAANAAFATFQRVLDDAV